MQFRMGRESELFQAARLGNASTIERLLTSTKLLGKGASGKPTISIATVRQGFVRINTFIPSLLVISTSMAVDVPDGLTAFL